MSANIREKTPRWWFSLVLLAVLCALFGIVSGIFVEITDSNVGNDEKPINWKKGFFRVTIVLSILFATLGGMVIFLAERNNDEFLLDFKRPGAKFGVLFVFIFIFLWFVYFIIQWPVYYTVNFIIEGFTS